MGESASLGKWGTTFLANLTLMSNKLDSEVNLEETALCIRIENGKKYVVIFLVRVENKLMRIHNFLNIYLKVNTFRGYNYSQKPINKNILCI